MRPMMNYEETMAWGAAQYADVLAALNDAGLPAVFTQTGGMCAAIEVQLETGWTLLVTDAEDTLAWARPEHEGWGVGMYDANEDRDEAIAFGQVNDGDIPSLLRLVRSVMFRREGTA